MVAAVDELVKLIVLPSQIVVSLAVKSATTEQLTPSHSTDTTVFVFLMAVGTALAIPPEDEIPMVLVMVD